LRDFFEVDAKHIVLATLGALVREKKIGVEVMKKAIPRPWNSIRKS
jgi:pyruvate dehydrogenase complex dehydrogenase (E1) component